MTALEEHPPASSPIAVIGIGCLFPKAKDLKAYWQLLLKGTDAITDVPPSHWLASDYYDQNPHSPDHVYCTRGGFLPPVVFDPSEFGIPPNTLEATDTSQLLGLLAAKSALEDAGYGSDKPFNRDRTSVILGVTGTQELVIPLGARLGHPKWRKALDEVGIAPDKAEAVIQRISESYIPWQENSFPGLLGNVVAGRISNRLDLGGTNCVVDAACASSLSAVHLALLELQSGRSDMVLSGGVDTLNDIFMHMCFAKSHVLSTSGDARPFSADADGTVLGEGIGIMVFKRLADAERDNDRIYAIIKGIGSASDGKSQSIYAPRPAGQEKALRAAYAHAGIDPASVGLIEAHGTGTRVGDQVEFEALGRVFGDSQNSKPKKALGSVKSMIGHTKAAAGAAGMIKSILALHHRTLPPTLKAEKPDAKLAIEDSPFYLNHRARPWLPEANQPRRAGVSAFGFGGSNFHVVLEEYKAAEREIAWDGSVDILAVSGTDRAAVKARLGKMVAEIECHPESGSRLAKHSRETFEAAANRRLLMVVDPSNSLANDLRAVIHALESGRALETMESPAVFFGDASPAGKVAFIFPGQGSQYVDMGRELMCVFPQAMAALEQADACYHGPIRLTDLIYPPEISSAAASAQNLRPTDVAQPAIAAVSLAMLNILRSFGIRPDATCGHSFGELTALHAAGWIDEEALLKLAVSRGRLMAKASAAAADRGSMLAVQAPLTELEKLTASKFPHLVLANRNSPNQGVLSGPHAQIESAAAACGEAGFKAVRLPVGAAFHSKLMEGALRPFAQALAGITFTPSEIPVFANTTAKPYPRDPRQAADLLSQQLANPVDFLNAIINLYDLGVRTFIEIGPQSILSKLVRTILPERPIQTIAVDASAGSKSAMRELACTLCQLAANGYPVELDRWEAADSQVRTPKIRITLQGANYRRPAPEKTDRTNAQRQPAADEKINHTGPVNDQIHPEPISNQIHSKQAIIQANSELTPMKREKHPNSANLLDALEIVQEGLRSMQALQSQTAGAHQKFLESQTEASRTLQAMMSSIQRLTENGLNLPAPAPVETATVAPVLSPPAVSHPALAVSPTPQTPPNEPNPAGITTPAESLPPVVEPLQQKTAAAPDHTAGTEMNPADEKLAATLLEVVSDLTGYPLEMLGMAMDIEADLGIDSIKRVEILSTLEEKMPHLPPVSPEVMGTLKTLGEIVACLTQNQPAAPRLSADGGVKPQSAGLSDSGPEPPSHNTDGLSNALLAVVSDLTGYPLEMLGLDMDIEADLGIDSIKRVEILSTLEEKMPDLPSVSPEVMGTLKTLGEIVAYLSGGAAPAPVSSESERQAPEMTISNEAMPPKPVEPPLGDKTGSSQSATARYAVRPVPIELPDHPELSLASDRKVFVTDDRTGLAQAIVDELGRRGINTVLVSMDILDFKAELPPACGLILTFRPETADADDEIGHAFKLSRYLAPSLMNSAAERGAFFASVSRLDGAFGLERIAGGSPQQGALAGLVKTAALEWPGVCCHAIDVDPRWQNSTAAAAAVVDTALRPGPVEIGLKKDRRATLDLVAEPCPTGQLHLEEGAVVVVSGGARGVTAAAALELSRRVRPTLILLGRSGMPTSEPEWLKGLDDAKAIRAAILENEFADGGATPVLIEEQYRKVTAAREIAATLDQLRAVTRDVKYIPVDVRDEAALRAVMQSVRSQYGPVAALIHGAGVLEDKLIVDKRFAQFKAVYDTKVKGLQNLLQAVNQDPLRYLVLFSSVTARMGNAGQADYAMANEVLNKIAQQESIRRTGCHVLSVNWGPWEGGMVTGALKREFARKGIALIPLKDGARCLINEMANPDHGSVEVVIGGPLNSTDEQETNPSSKAVQDRTDAVGYSLAFERELDLDSHPILKSHVIGGKAVVPLALIAEWICHCALHENPGLLVQGLDDIRILKGIRFDNEKKRVRLMAGKIQTHNDGYAVDVELRNGFQDGNDILHCRARAVLTETLVTPPEVDLRRLLEDNGYNRSAADIYADILFHGQKLHGIRKVVSCSPTGMVARVSAAPSPADWIKSPLRNSWIADPLVLDSAFQMASLWCFEQHRTVSLPSYAASYRQYHQRFPGKGCTVALEITDSSRHKMRGDFTFLDDRNGVIARLTGFEAVMDASLNRAFKPDFETSN